MDWEGIKDTWLDWLKVMSGPKAFTKEDLRDAFEQSRLTNPMVGFKYDTFEDFVNAKTD